MFWEEIQVPMNVRQALLLDKENGNTFWTDAIQKEMTNVGIAFEILEGDNPLPRGWKQVSGHLIFDVTMDFTRKA